MFLKGIKFTIFIVLFCNISSCEFKDDVELKVIVDNKNRINEELIVKAFLTKKNWEIVRAYFDCENDKSINNRTEGITGCNKELMVKNDTIYIGFTPTEFGIKKFGGIEVLIKDEKSNLKIISGSFNYNVVRSK